MDEQPAPTPAPLTVLYDGSCPLCRREIAVYRGLNAERPLCFADVSDEGQVLPAESSRAQLMARFHVIDGQGRLLSGAAAFFALWAGLPGWRYLALLGRLPGMAWLMERAYCGFLVLRPALQRAVARWDRPA